MSKLKITDKIRKEEKKKTKPIIAGIIIIIACWLAINFILKMSYNILAYQVVQGLLQVNLQS